MNLISISESALAEGNYSSAEIVIPEIVYDGNYDAGIFIEGDYLIFCHVTLIFPKVTKTLGT